MIIWLMYFLFFLNNVYCMDNEKQDIDRIYNDYEHPVKPLLAFTSLNDIATYAQGHEKEQILPILITSSHDHYNHVIAYILANSLKKPNKVCVNINNPDLPDASNANVVILCQLSALRSKYYKQQNANTNLGKDEEESASTQTVSKKNKATFLEKLKEYQKAGMVIIATETNLEMLPKPIQNMFLHMQQPPYKTIVSLQQPSPETWNYISNVYALLNKRNNYYFYDTYNPSMVPLTMLDATFYFANLFEMYTVSEVELRQIVERIAPEVSDKKIIRIRWTKQIIREIATIGHACSRCLIPTDKIEHVKLKDCCSKVLCKACYTSRAKWSKQPSPKKNCPECGSKIVVPLLYS